MKILFINQDWFAEEFRAAGHEVVVCGTNPNLPIPITEPFIHIDSLLKNSAAGFEPDRIIVWDNSSPMTLCGFDETDIPVLFYSVDTHHHFELHRHLYNVFDAMFVAQPDYLSFFAEWNQSPQWLPLWAPRFVEPGKDKKPRAVFVGNMYPELNPERGIFLEALAKKTDLLTMQGEYWKIFPEHEIIINQTVKRDVNFRVFEAMMCGSLLLTERTENGLPQLFRDGEHLVTYTKNDVDDAADKIRYYLDHANESRRIAQAGRDEILARHRPEHRAATVLAVVEGLTKKRSDQKHLSALVNYAVLAQRMQQKKIEMGTVFTAFVSALRSAELAVAAGERMNNEIGVHILTAAYGYDMMTREHAGRNIVNVMHEAHPDCLALTYGKIWNLMNTGQTTAARHLAESIVPGDAEAAFRKVEQLIMTVVPPNG